MTTRTTSGKCHLHEVHHPSVGAWVSLRVGSRPDETIDYVVCPTGAANVMLATKYLDGEITDLDTRLGVKTWDLARAITARGGGVYEYPF